MGDLMADVYGDDVPDVSDPEEDYGNQFRMGVIREMRTDPQVITSELFIKLVAELMALSLVNVRSEAFTNFIITKLVNDANNPLLHLDLYECINISEFSPENLTEEKMNNHDNHMVRWIYARYVRLDWSRVFWRMSYETDKVLSKVNIILQQYPIEVIHTDLSTCIAVVRSRVEADDEFEAPADAEPKSVMMTEGQLITIRPRKGKILGIPNHDPSLLEINQDLAVYNFDHDKVIFNSSPLYTLLGTSTRGSSKLIDCLIALGGKIPLPDYLSMACLVEGEGGFIEVLSSLTRNSTFVYVARPEGYQEVTRPNLTTNALAMNYNDTTTLNM